MDTKFAIKKKKEIQNKEMLFINSCETKYLFGPDDNDDDHDDKIDIDSSSSLSSKMINIFVDQEIIQSSKSKIINVNAIDDVNVNAENYDNDIADDIEKKYCFFCHSQRNQKKCLVNEENGLTKERVKEILDEMNFEIREFRKNHKFGQMDPELAESIEQYIIQLRMKNQEANTAVQTKVNQFNR